MNRPRVDAPPLTHLALEMLATVEHGTFAAALPLLRLVEGGDGHPVLVLPGFGASDTSTTWMRSALASIGHRVHGWRLGRNLGPHPHVLDGMTLRMLQLRRSSGQKVSLVGWSLGGIYAREMARQHPDAVRQVIGLASPFRFRPGDRSHASALYDMAHPAGSPFDGHTLEEHERPPLTVPFSAVYSRTDGIVRWHLCAEEDRPLAENVEVYGTHSGLAHNISAIVAIADRLSQPEGAWRRFAPPPALRHLYPRPEYWGIRRGLTGAGRPGGRFSATR